MDSKDIPFSTDFTLFRSARTKAVTATVFLGILGLITVVSVIFATMEILMLNRALAGDSVPITGFVASQDRQLYVLIAQWIALLATVIFSLMWVNRATANLISLRLQSESAPQFSPGWAVGWWFVPIMNFFRPYQVMAELWRRSFHVNGVSWLLPVWWSLWLAGSLIGAALARQGVPGPYELGFDIIATRTANIGTIVVDGFLLVPGVMVVILLWQITGAQERRWEALRNGKGGNP